MPEDIQISTIDTNAVIISWTNEMASVKTYIRYRPVGMTTWIKMSTNQNSITISVLGNTTYELQLNSCDPTNPLFWTAILNFTTLGGSLKPNIILILLDDARYDFYSCNGAPSFYQTPNIDRIANEGLNCINSFCVFSLCAPSRASLFSGQYAVETHVTNNFESYAFNYSLPNIAGILKNNMYYTAMIGKSDGIPHYSKGYYDYWLDCFPTYYQYLDSPKKSLPGYVTDVLTDSAVKVIGSATDGKPLFLWLAYKAPHEPVVVDPAHDTYYGNTLPLGDDTLPFTNNYPSCIYTLNQANNFVEGGERDSLWYRTYGAIAQLDSNIGRLFTALEASGRLENSMILFTSDNGHMLGEHGGLDLKRLGYDESMRVPLFIRYPQWFPNESVMGGFTINLDIPTTILDAAGIENTFEMPGISVKNMFDGDTIRKSVYYHYWYSAVDGYQKLPAIYAIRDFFYKYIAYDCSSTTEEFFDMVNDPQELENLVNNSAYDSIIASYRSSLSLIKAQLGDTLQDTLLSCYLVENEKAGTPGMDSENDLDKFSVYPNPASDRIFVYTGKNESVEIYSSLGVHLRSLTGNEFDISDLAAGIYLLKTGSGKSTFIKQ
jgi:arylsulfatase A-like enzyme